MKTIEYLTYDYWFPVPQDSWFTSVFQITSSCLYIMWSNLIATLLIMVLTAIIIYLITFINRRSKYESIDIKVPTIVTQNPNIHLWLQQFDVYFHQRHINSDKDKQELLMSRLDHRTANTIKHLHETKQIKSYDDLVYYLTIICNPDAQYTNYLKCFAERYQRHNESLLDYYNDILNLARKAYPDMPTSTLNKYINKQFIIGLHNPTIKHELILKDTSHDFDAFSEAVKLQERVNKYPVDLVVVNHVSRQQQSHYNNSTRAQGMIDFNNNVQDVRVCYNCNSPNHVIKNCPNRASSQYRSSSNHSQTRETFSRRNSNLDTANTVPRNQQVRFNDPNQQIQNVPSTINTVQSTINGSPLNGH
jgi:hypothetical protein